MAFYVCLRNILWFQTIISMQSKRTDSTHVLVEIVVVKVFRTRYLQILDLVVDALHL